jgi:hypothetical protein
MKNRMNLGDLVLFKTHPYTYNLNPIKISGNALFTPPIMVIDQLSYKDLDKSKISKVRCRFYNSNVNKIEENWFQCDELELLTIPSTTSFNSDYEQFGCYTLKSCIDELKKLKAIFQIENSQTKTLSTSFLNYLPPVFIVTDIVTLSAKGNLKLKDFCSTGYKVKWFSPDSGKFKEDILPQAILTKIDKSKDISFIELAIKDKSIFKYDLVNPIKIQSTDILLTQSLFRITDMRYNHISVILKVYDILLNTESEMLLEEFNNVTSARSTLYSDYFINKYPKLVGKSFLYPHEIPLKIGLIYNITYLNAQGEKTSRCIVILKIIGDDIESEEGKLLEAFCLLRRDIRYFWTKRIIQLSESNYKLF